MDVLWAGTALTAVLQVFYSYYFFRHIWNMPNDKDGINHRAQAPGFAATPLSVIICAKNEGCNLRQNLGKILDLDYRWPDGTAAFEVIVVNDASIDDSAEVLQYFTANFEHLSVIDILSDEHRTLPGKKFPLSRALAAAKHEWIVCTDADCTPGSAAWLHFMAAPLEKGKAIVAGYSGYNNTKRRLNTFIRHETVHTFIQYYSFARAGLPYMAVGRNLAATKAVFQKAGDHPAWSKLPSGDDDLLVQLCATSDNMAVISHPASFTWSAGKDGFREYISQKRRHVSTGKYYSLPTKLAVGIYALLHLLWWVLLVTGLIVGMPLAALIMLAIPMLLLLVSFQYAASLLKERNTVIGWFAFSFCWVLYNALLAPYILWKTKQRWK